MLLPHQTESEEKRHSFSGQIIDMVNLVKGLENATLHLLHLVSVLQNLVPVNVFLDV